MKKHTGLTRRALLLPVLLALPLILAGGIALVLWGPALSDAVRAFVKLAVLP